MPGSCDWCLDTLEVFPDDLAKADKAPLLICFSLLMVEDGNKGRQYLGSDFAGNRTILDSFSRLSNKYSLSNCYFSTVLDAESTAINREQREIPAFTALITF